MWNFNSVIIIYYVNRSEKNNELLTDLFHIRMNNKTIK